MSCHTSRAGTVDKHWILVSGPCKLVLMQQEHSWSFTPQVCAYGPSPADVAGTMLRARLDQRTRLWVQQESRVLSGPGTAQCGSLET
eukprot:15478694-Alexandrium_andersonii.AAC.1